MLKITILFILIFSISKSDWKDLEGPKTGNISTQTISFNDELIIISSANNVYMSFDDGQTWEKRSQGISTEISNINSFLIKDDLIYFTAQGSIEPKREGGLYVSTDKGLNWNLVKSEYKDYQFKNLSINNNSDLFLILNSKLLKSTDNGLNWDTLFFTTAIDGADYYELKGDTIITGAMAGRDRQGNLIGSGFMFSSDKGKTWEKRNEGLDLTIRCLHLNDDIIYVGTEAGISYSNNFGESWNSLSLGLNNNPVFNINSNKEYIFASLGVGLFYLKKGENIWKSVDELNNEEAVKQIATFNNDVVLATSKGVFKRKSNEELFNKLNFQKTPHVLDLFTYNDTLYVSTYNNGVHYSADGGKTYSNYQKVNDLLDSISSSPFQFRKYGDTILVLGYLANKFYFSIDYGNSWNETYAIFSQTINIHKSRNSYFSSHFGNKVKFTKNLLQQPLWERLDFVIVQDTISSINTAKIETFNEDLYLYGQYGIYFSSNTGITWRQLIDTTQQTNSEINKTVFDNYITALNVTNNTLTANVISNGIYISYDNGKNWDLVNSELKNLTINKIIRYKNNIILQTNNGVYYSNDNAVSFTEYNNNLTPDMKLYNNDLVLYGDKLYLLGYDPKYTDLSELGIEYSSVEKTENRDYLWTYPPYPQPTNNIVKIDTYWDSGLPFTEEDIEVYDLTGVKIKTENTLSIQKESAYNGKIIWDVSSHQPGIYIMKITHGTETRVRRIMVVE